MKNPLLALAWKLLKRQELEIDSEKCVRCGKCARLCHHNAIMKTPENKYEIQTDRCARCYHCKENCPKQAIAEK